MRKPINTTPDGCAFAITTSLPDHAGITNLTLGGGHFPCTGVIEITYEDMDDSEEGQGTRSDRKEPRP